MPASFAEQFRADIRPLAANDPQFAVQVVERLLDSAQQANATDVHLRPEEEGLDVRWRIDGVLQPVALLPKAVATNIVARLKVMAGLLTYRLDYPQEGRINLAGETGEMRVSTYPTIFGEKVVIRLFAAAAGLQHLCELSLPGDVLTGLERLLTQTSGALLVTGPAGSGKTTALYACLRHVAQHSAGGRNMASIEDPVEVVVPGVAQSQVNLAADFDLATGLRFLMRQDPEVILVGEIRDSATAQTALQASLTGHLVLTGFHAASAVGSLSRLTDMGIPPYVLRGGVLAVLNQRLMRRLCSCAQQTHDPTQSLGLNAGHAFLPTGCGRCSHSGYHGRVVLAEFLDVQEHGITIDLLRAGDANQMEAQAQTAGMLRLWRRVPQLLQSGQTSPAEIRRVLGFSDSAGA